MHAKIYVENFGPIKNAKLELDYKFQVLVGPQASGKSTLCRVAYFCKKIRDYTVQFLTNFEKMNQGHPSEAFNNLKKHLTSQFMGCFGTTKHMQPFQIRYFFEDNAITIKLERGYVRFIFSKDLQDQLNLLIDSAFKIHNNRAASAFDTEAVNLYSILLRSLVKRVYDAFKYDDEIIYIPAGRSVLATMSEQLQDMPYSAMDLTMQEFVKRIKETRNNFGFFLKDVVQNYLKTVTGQINNAAVELAIQKIHSILKAEYTCDKDGEKLYYDEEHWVKLIYASSGQQESLWVLLPVFLQILRNKKTFIVIEEPEAHLFPDAQRTIVELIALLAHTTGSTVMLTTHSPYILTAANLLVYSGFVEKQNNKDKAVIPVSVRIDPAGFIGYGIDEGKMRNIYDTEEHMMDVEYIDKISSIINEDLDKLLEIQYK